MKKLNKRILSAALALTLLAGTQIGAFAESVKVFENEFNTETNMWTSTSENNPATRTLVEESNGNKYVSVTGKFASQQVLLQIANVNKTINLNNNYAVYQFKTKISENQNGIRFYRQYTPVGGTSTNEMFTVNIDKSLRGIDSSVEWINVKIVYDGQKYLPYINGVPSAYIEINKNVTEYTDSVYRFTAANAVTTLDTATVDLDNILVTTVSKTDDVKLGEITGDDEIQLNSVHEIGTITSKYDCKLTDLMGNEAVSSGIVWSVENAQEGITIDSDGVVTVAEGVKAGSFDVVVSCGESKAIKKVTLKEKILPFQEEKILISNDFNDGIVGSDSYNYKVQLYDNSKNKDEEGYVSPFELVEIEPNNIAVKMTTPAITEMGEKYKVHQAQFQTDTGAINDDIFVVSMKYKYEASGTDALRLELKAKDGKQINYHLSAKEDANFNYKHSIGKWNEVKYIFNRKDKSYKVYNANVLAAQGTADEAFWTNGIDYLRVVHCTDKANLIPTDGKEHTAYIDDYKVYVPSGLTLEGLYATAVDGIKERNVLNLITGFDSYPVGTSPKLSYKELTINLTYMNNSENAVKATAVAALYEGDRLKALSPIEVFEVGANSLSSSYAVKLLLPGLKEDETFENYSVKVMSWYENDMRPFDYTFKMTNDRWNFAE